MRKPTSGDRRELLAQEMDLDASAASSGPFRVVLAEDFERHYRSFVHPGFHALLVYRLGHWGLCQVDPVRRGVKIIHRLLNRLIIQNVYGAEIADDAFIGRRVSIGHQQGVQIPSYAVIGDDSVIRHNVTLGLGARDIRSDVPRLGRRVKLGTGATLIGPISIGEGATIGPHALVMVNVPEGATAFSPPARILRPPADEAGTS